MPPPPPYIFVLWADKFDEAAAAIFVTELRKAGLRVKVVSLSRRQIGGAAGLALVPDLTLEQALPLAGQTSCLIIPSALSVARRLKNDPRLRQFVDLAQANQARFVIGRISGASPEGLGLPALPSESVIIYPERETLFEFAREVARSLALLPSPGV